MDLDALGIKYENVSSNEKTDCKTHSDHMDIYWIISLFSDGNHFHFIRKSYNGIWYHKFGYFAPVINHDFDKKIITNPQFANIENYKLIKTYRLEHRKNLMK